jgi:hypothetical protein
MQTRHRSRESIFVFAELAMIGAQAGSTVRKGAIAAVIFMLGTGLAGAQDMEPRAFSASPIDTNFLIGSYQRTTGDVALDADLPIRDVKAAINSGILAYDRTFDLFGQTGSVAIVLPYFHGNLSGNVGGDDKQITRQGFGDLAFRRRIQSAATNQHQFPSLGISARDWRVATDRKLVRGGVCGRVDVHR